LLHRSQFLKRFRYEFAFVGLPEGFTQNRHIGFAVKRIRRQGNLKRDFPHTQGLAHENIDCRGHVHAKLAEKRFGLRFHVSIDSNVQIGRVNHDGSLFPEIATVIIDSVTHIMRNHKTFHTVAQDNRVNDVVMAHMSFRPSPKPTPSSSLVREGRFETPSPDKGRDGEGFAGVGRGFRGALRRARGTGRLCKSGTPGQEGLAAVELAFSHDLRFKLPSFPPCQGE
jgi:hypothetical protein